MVVLSLQANERDPVGRIEEVRTQTYSYAGINRIRFKGLHLIEVIETHLRRGHPLGFRRAV